jgi:hypothetical protein
LALKPASGKVFAVAVDLRNTLLPADNHFWQLALDGKPTSNESRRG